MKTELIRHCSADQFTQIPNLLLRDTSVSIKARGVLCYLLSHSGEWDHFRSKVMNDCGLGKAAYYSVMNELEESGYIIRKKGGFPAKYKLYITDYKGGLEKLNTDSSDSPVTRLPENQDVRESETHKNNNGFKNNNLKPRRKSASGQKPEKIKIPKPPTARYPEQMESYSRRWFKRSVPMGMSAEDSYYWLIQKRSEALADGK